MKNAELFDDYAERYAAEVDDAIKASGYTSDFFADLKAELVAARGGARAHGPLEVLDFGCGIGATTRALAREHPRARVTGVDVSRESVVRAERLSRSEGTRAAYVVGDESGLPFADASFDLAFTSCVFHHIERDQHPFWIRELRRVLRPGGRFFLFEHNPYNPLTRRVVRECPFDEGVILLEPGYARGLVSGGGFVAESPTYYFFFPRLLGRLRPLERYLGRIPIGAQYYVVGAAADR